ncbi:hypothetical protein ASPZODRAFT_1313958 [Penicilliopsis zonata CBS 506.65]|uniref:NAD-dependent epimerase/dehydratase domain-containing protein n=1 Tax=Penicilliopsis zonata CBS 506.65 TaxID=1073090 RepID=A0A1L9S5H2_9EURO|nr:hypothetical protein ASPZODRAFT_1313958 [Penicilliopsis zonata CBS 506.65]OJJ42413.1 hypothetical protein ASPZODRAFT_1313958 [Penicilliopsis zonata CBS 506.65]
MSYKPINLTMKFLITGATGFVGSAVVDELLAAGHSVVGLARSDASAALLQAKGVQVLRGTLADHSVLKQGASECEGVAHLAFDHDFAKFAENAVEERAAIEALASALEGTNKPLVVTSGTMAMVRENLVGSEDTPVDMESPMKIRTATETVVLALAARGIRSSVVRLAPSVHGDGDRGFVYRISAAAKEHGESLYIGQGSNCWPAVHRRDAARLYRLALEKGVAGSRYHAVGEEAVPTRAIAEAIGQSLQVPVVSKTVQDAVQRLGFVGYPFAADSRASSTKTQQELGWTPREATLLEDIGKGVYN